MMIEGKNNKGDGGILIEEEKKNDDASSKQSNTANIKQTAFTNSKTSKNASNTKGADDAIEIKTSKKMINL